MAEEIKIGDVVVLKSGSPKMTVFGVVEAKRKFNPEWGLEEAAPAEQVFTLVECTWFDAETPSASLSGVGEVRWHQPTSRGFIAECLNKVA